jgi:Tfp pilus assembly protein PilF
VAHELNLGTDSVHYCIQAINLNRQKRMEGDPENELILEENTFNAAALIYKQNGMLQEAVDHYEAGLDVNPDSFEILANLAALLTDAGEHEAAIVYFNRAAVIQPNSAELETNIGWLLELQGRLTEARDKYARALELMHPNSHPQIVNNLNNVNARIQLIRQAEAEAQMAGEAAEEEEYWGEEAEIGYDGGVE